jgi:hypothetical protein
MDIDGGDGGSDEELVAENFPKGWDGVGRLSIDIFDQGDQNETQGQGYLAKAHLLLSV